MTCEITSEGNVLFVLWGRPGYADIPLILQAADTLSGETERPFVLIARVPADAPPPDADVQSALNQRMGRLLRHCTAFHTLLEGSGFFNVVKRSVLSAIFMASGRRKTFFVHGSVTELRRNLASDPSVRAVEAALLVATKRGMLTRSLSGSKVAPRRP